MDLQALRDQFVAFVMVREHPDREDEIAVLTVKVEEVEGGYQLNLGEDSPPVPFPPGLESQVNPTPPEMLELLDGSPYFVGFEVGEGGPESLRGAIPLGFVWPGFEDAS